MSTIITRAGKGTPLTNNEVDANFVNLNTDKYQSGDSASFLNLAYTGTLTGGTGILNIGSGQLYKAASGNVGIGTSNPNSLLDVAGTISIGGKSTLNTTGANTVNLGGIANNGLQTLAFYTNTTGNIATLRATIDASGNLGLGVAPNAGFATGRWLQISSASVFGQQQNGTPNVICNAYESAANTFNYILTAGAARYNVQAGAHAWFTAPSGTAGNTISFTQAMTLDASGNLGIGVAPSAKLQVNAGALGNLIIAYNGTSFNYYDADTQVFRAAAGTERMRITSAGNVGIGTSSPNEKLQVAGAILATGTLAAVRTSATCLDFTAGNTRFISMGADASTKGGFIWYNSTNAAVTEAMRIDSSGNLGIGTSSASSRVTIQGSPSTRFVQMYTTGTNEQYSAIGAQYSSGSAYCSSELRFGNESTGFGTGFLSFATGTNTVTERMRITSAGLVGIGTTAPVASRGLTLNSTANYFGISLQTSGVTRGQIIQESTGNIYVDAGTDGGAGALILRTNTGTERMRITSAGLVGIGLTDANYKLAVGGATGSQYIQIRSDANNSTLGLLFASGTGNNDGGIFYEQSTDNMWIRVNGSEQMRIDSAGNVLVGTTTNTNSSKVVVNGTISETVGSTQYLVASQYDVGTAPNKIPLNQYLGSMAYQDSNAVNLTGGTAVIDNLTADAINLKVDTDISNIAPSLNLDFANSKQLDPRITYTRASTATYYDGVTTAKAEENLTNYSEQFNNAIWAKANLTVAPDATTAPNGTTTADEIISSATSTYVAIGNSTPFFGITGQPITLSVYAKQNTHAFIQLIPSAGILGSAFANFNITAGAGAVGTFGGTGLTSSISDAGNGWYRCSITIASALGSGIMNVYLVDSASATRAANYTGTVGNSFYLWGAQAEIRSAVSAYTPTTTQAITNYIPALQTAASGVARFEHNPTTGESLGLLIEESRTNLLTYSEDFSNAALWSKSAAVFFQSNVAISPDGTLTADKFGKVSGSTSLAQLYKAITLTTAAYTWSVYAKAGEHSWLCIDAYDGAVQRTSFNLATGTVGTNPAGNTATIVPVGNGWYRCSVTRTLTNASSYFDLHSINADNNTGYTGDGYSGIYIWGAQLEAGAFATSYIPTVASQVTRAADAASMTGTNFSSWFNNQEGTFYGSAVATSPSGVTSGSASQTVLTVLESTLSGIQVYRPTSTTNGGFYVGLRGATQALITQAGFLANTETKLAGAYKVNDFSFSVNGAASLTDTLGEVPLNSTSFSIGSVTSTYGFLNGTIKKIQYFPKRLTNAELVEMTTI